MNKKDRKQIEKARQMIQDAKEILEVIKDQELEKYDNLSEGLQQSERGQAFEAHANTLEEIVGNLETAADELNDIENE